MTHLKGLLPIEAVTRARGKAPEQNRSIGNGRRSEDLRKKRFSFSQPLDGQRLEGLKRSPFDQASRYFMAQTYHATTRRILGAAVVLVSISAFQGPSAFAQSPPPITVTVTQDSPPPARQRTPVKRDPWEILGIRIESNGALITGPVNARRTYIALDRPIVPEGMRGLWARSLDVCRLPSERENAEAQAVAKDNVLITNQEIVAKQRLQILRTFVPLPSTATLAMLQSGRRLVLPARKHKRAPKILVIVSTPDGQRNYSEISLLSQGQTIDLQNRSSHETAVRCASNG